MFAGNEWTASFNTGLWCNLCKQLTAFGWCASVSPRLQTTNCCWSFSQSQFQKWRRRNSQKHTGYINCTKQTNHSCCELRVVRCQGGACNLWHGFSGRSYPTFPLQKSSNLESLRLKPRPLVLLVSVPMLHQLLQPEVGIQTFSGSLQHQRSVPPTLTEVTE